MGSTLLHKDKKPPPDELAQRDAPACKNCGQQMFLARLETKISDDGARSKRIYEMHAMRGEADCVNRI
jgi:hypothetical protein